MSSIDPDALGRLFVCSQRREEQTGTKVHGRHDTAPLHTISSVDIESFTFSNYDQLQKRLKGDKSLQGVYMYLFLVNNGVGRGGDEDEVELDGVSKALLVPVLQVSQ